MATGDVNFDASDITWAHAVNSREAVERELSGPLDFIESDVSLGVLKDRTFDPLMPILAHPPETTSDISLEDFLKLASGTTKGIKLDFKSIEVVEPSLIILQKHADKMNYSLWLNADILAGPIKASGIPVKVDTFFLLCRQYFPTAVLSVGWTTEWYITYSPDMWHYDWEHVRKMADIIRCFGYEGKFPTYTFPVRAIFASRSIKQLQWLLGVIPDSSLTVWSGLKDFLELEDLLRIRSSFPLNKVYYDVPDPVGSTFQEAKNQTVPTIKNISVNKNQWMTFTRGPVSECPSFTYTTNNFIVFGRSINTAVLLRKLITIDDDHGLKVQAKVRFFSAYDQKGSSSFGHELTLSIVDVSLLSKNISADSLNLSHSDTEILWTAMNKSKVHTFEHNQSDQCRIFKLDTNADRSFQAWVVPCYEMDEKQTLEEIAVFGQAEVPSNKRLVLPKGPFMIGFMSSGEGHVVIQDFEISDKKEKNKTNASSTISITMGFFTILFLYGIMRRFSV
ncbi:hypothetical protein JTE90_016932 [Oedothorax gibbosus]|uniref:Menorin-like domain-containing protein n=1 Tax=Oedothorax gibbosus TaxID=931172 RepID=A0AAV6USS2_9ARAC|nr:hypothetical protein JTE90_016932 [Oedothorax gibbosus]